MEIESMVTLRKKKTENGGAAWDTVERQPGVRQASALADFAARIRARLGYLHRELMARMARARITEKDGEIKVEWDLPGVEAEAVEVQIDQDSTIRVRALRHEEHEVLAGGCHRVERKERAIRREVRLGLPVDAGSAQLALHNGVLSLKLKRAVHAEGLPKEIRLTADT
jgi:HSP20 family molecular chaperone IbpA